MISADTDQSEVHSTGTEPMALLEMRDQVRQFLDRDVLTPPALLTDKVVMVGVITEVEDRRTVSEMNVVESAHGLQRVDGPVHRGRIDPSALLGFGPRMYVGRCEVLA